MLAASKSRYPMAYHPVNRAVRRHSLEHDGIDPVVRHHEQEEQRIGQLLLKWAQMLGEAVNGTGNALRSF